MRLKLILKIKNWCEEIIVVIIISIIIESLIPNSNNKKYIKVIIGIYTMYVTINPILNFINYDFNIEENLLKNLKTEEVNVDLNNIKDVYIDGIEEELKKDINSLGYEVIFLNVFVDNNYENIEKVELKVNPNTEQEIIKQYIFDNYLVSTDNIIFKE